MPCRTRTPLLITALAVGLTIAHAAQPAQCEVQAGARAPVIVELYTSEGCSSCPPADRWLSSLNDQRGVLPLAFHVNYWNHLGWQDRFATPATTQRQHRVRAVQSGRYVYTPQVVLNGQDHRAWHGQSPASLKQSARDTSTAPPPSLTIRRNGSEVQATVGAAPGAAALAGYWAVLQDGLVSRVTRGENAGETLTHDHVVSLYQPVPAWPGDQPKALQLSLPEGPAFEALRVAFVVTQPDLVNPVQAAVLNCSTAVR